MPQSAGRSSLLRAVPSLWASETRLGNSCLETRDFGAANSLVGKDHTTCRSIKTRNIEIPGKKD